MSTDELLLIAHRAGRHKDWIHWACELCQVRELMEVDE